MAAVTVVDVDGVKIGGREFVVILELPQLTGIGRLVEEPLC